MTGKPADIPPGLEPDDLYGDLTLSEPHDSPPVRWVIPRSKRLRDITPADVPPGLEPEDIAIDG